MAKSMTMLAILAAVGVLLRVLDIGGMAETEWVDREIRNSGSTGIFIFLAFGTIFTGIGLPRQAIAFLGGYAYDITGGTLLALIAQMLGCWLSFIYARFFGRDFIMKRFGKRLRKINSFLAKSPLSMTLAVRSLPVGSNILTNLAAGVSSIPAVPFLIASALGYLPQTFIFALLGSGIQVDPFWRISLGVVLMALSSALGLAVYLRHRKAARAMMEESEGTPDMDAHTA
jgi:uncharacterized membrane protein YdjX (TVP38/TMEM64 family)